MKIVHENGPRDAWLVSDSPRNAMVSLIQTIEPYYLYCYKCATRDCDHVHTVVAHIEREIGMSHIRDEARGGQ